MFVTLDLAIVTNVSPLCFGKDTHWQKQHGNLSPTVGMLLPQLPPFTNASLNHIQRQNDARRGVVVRAVSAFIC